MSIQITGGPTAEKPHRRRERRRARLVRPRHVEAAARATRVIDARARRDATPATSCARPRPTRRKRGNAPVRAADERRRRRWGEGSPGLPSVLPEGPAAGAPARAARLPRLNSRPSSNVDPPVRAGQLARLLRLGDPLHRRREQVAHVGQPLALASAARAAPASSRRRTRSSPPCHRRRGPRGRRRRAARRSPARRGRRSARAPRPPADSASLVVGSSSGASSSSITTSPAG